MKAKDTVMKLTETGNDGILVKTMTKILGEQAEISFKAGIKAVVEWGNETCKEHSISNLEQRKRECKYCWESLKRGEMPK